MAAVVVVVVIVAFVNALRTGGNKSENSVGAPSALPGPNPTAAVPTPGPSSGGGGGSSGGTDVPAVACPTIRDEESHLSYNCIDNYLRQGVANNYLGLRISLDHETEVGWVISEGSGNPKSVIVNPSTGIVAFRQGPSAVPSNGSIPTSAPPSLADVQTEVQRRTENALAQAYGDGPSPKTLAAHTQTFSGATGYELVTEITINPAFRAANNIKAQTERLWVVGVPTSAGVSIFMMSIPDDRKDLWPKAEATVATIKII